MIIMMIWLCCFEDYNAVMVAMPFCHVLCQCQLLNWRYRIVYRTTLPTYRCKRFFGDTMTFLIPTYSRVSVLFWFVTLCWPIRPITGILAWPVVILLTCCDTRPDPDPVIPYSADRPFHSCHSRNAAAILLPFACWRYCYRVYSMPFCWYVLLLTMMTW